jgi:HK97 family phage major capsid protein
MTAIAIPENPAELEDFLNDDAKVKAVAAQEGGLTALLKAAARKTMEKDASIAAQIREQTQLIFHEMMEANGMDSKKSKVNLNWTEPIQANRAARRHQPNPDAAGAVLNGEFPNIAAYLQTIWNKANLKGDAAEKLQRVRDFSEKIPSEGGFLVPEEFRAELLIASLGSAVVRPRARVIPMSSATLRFPKIDETSRVSSVYGGIVVYRTEEGEELVESQAAFGSIKLEATKQTALAHVTNELVKDAPAFGGFIEQTFPEAMAYYEDLDFLLGTGVGEPLGSLNSNNTAIISVAKETGQLASTVLWMNIIRMYARMLPSSLGSAVWLASPDVFVELATMALEVGTGGSAVWLTDAHGTPVLTLLGRPVIMTERAPAALGTRGDLSFVDFGMYLIGDRQMMTAASSEHVKFTSDKTTYRLIARNDGRPWLESPITPHNNSATLSPFVQLETRA